MADVLAFLRVTRTIMNRHEPDNRLELYYAPTESPHEHVWVGCSMNGRFVEGISVCGFWCQDDGNVFWWSDADEARAGSVASAWENLPALVTDPEHFEETAPVLIRPVTAAEVRLPYPRR